VDLVVIVENGYQRSFENAEGQNFEIIYTTAESALEYWKLNPNDAANLWEVAQVLFDRNGKISDLKSETLKFLACGKKALDSKSKAQLRFSAEDTLLAVKNLKETDITTASLVLEKTVLTLAEQYFDIRQLWIPAPKQRTNKIKEIDKDFYDALSEYYAESVTLNKKIELTEGMIHLVFTNKSSNIVE
jgi:hypothetical protein